MYYSPVDTHVGMAYNSCVTMWCGGAKFGLIDFIYGCDNLVAVSVYISIINFGYKIYPMITKLGYNGFQGAIHHDKNITRVLFASTYTRKQLKTIYYSL